MAARRVKNGFGKNERACRGWVTECLIVKSAGIIHATAHDAQNNPDAETGDFGTVLPNRFDSSRDSEVADWTRPAETGVGQKAGTRWRWRHLANAQRLFPAWT